MEARRRTPRQRHQTARRIAGDALSRSLAVCGRLGAPRLVRTWDAAQGQWVGSWSRVNLCSVPECPLCGPYYAREAARETGLGFEALLRDGLPYTYAGERRSTALVPVLLTLTMPHSRHDRPAQLVEAIRAGYSAVGQALGGMVTARGRDLRSERRQVELRRGEARRALEVAEALVGPAREALAGAVEWGLRSEIEGRALTLDGLREEVAGLRHQIETLTQRLGQIARELRRHEVSWLARVEVTYGRAGLHPHVHAALFVPAGELAAQLVGVPEIDGDGYERARGIEWRVRDAWQEATRSVLDDPRAWALLAPARLCEGPRCGGASAGALAASVCGGSSSTGTGERCEGEMGAQVVGACADTWAVRQARGTLLHRFGASDGPTSGGVHAAVWTGAASSLGRYTWGLSSELAGAGKSRDLWSLLDDDSTAEVWARWHVARSRLRLRLVRGSRGFRGYLRELAEVEAARLELDAGAEAAAAQLVEREADARREVVAEVTASVLRWAADQGLEERLAYAASLGPVRAQRMWASLVPPSLAAQVHWYEAGTEEGDLEVASREVIELVEAARGGHSSPRDWLGPDGLPMAAAEDSGGARRWAEIRGQVRYEARRKYKLRDVSDPVGRLHTQALVESEV